MLGNNRFAKLKILIALAAAVALTVLPASPANAIATTPVYRLYGPIDAIPSDYPCDPNTHPITGANYAMRVCYNYASPGRYSPVGRVSFGQDYAGSHVTACQLHLVVTDDTDGSHPAEVNSNCLDQARRTDPPGLGTYFWRVGISSPAVIPRGHSFHVTFWINMRTSCCYYETYGRASRINGYSS